MENLNKENFFDAIMIQYPRACQHFCDWIDVYKTNINWSKLFIPGTYHDVKFHDIPIEMQFGIIVLWLHQLTFSELNEFNMPKVTFPSGTYSEIGFRDDITKAFRELDKCLSYNALDAISRIETANPEY